MKTCNKCGGTEFISGGKCKACAKARASAYYAKNKDAIKARSAAWAAANKEHKLAVGAAYRATQRATNADATKAYKKAYYEANKVEVLAQQMAYHELNRDHRLAVMADYREAKPELIAAGKKRWTEANRDRHRLQRANRRAKKREVGGVLSPNLVKRLMKLQKGVCPCCNKPLNGEYHSDHIMPLALGGSNTDDNMQLLHPKCNLKKGAKHPVDFMQTQGFLL